MITIRLSDAILNSKIGALDRSLGFVFGAARGLLLCAIAFIFFNWLAPDAASADAEFRWRLRNQWLANSKSLPLLKATSDQLLAPAARRSRRLARQVQKAQARPDGRRPAASPSRAQGRAGDPVARQRRPKADAGQDQCCDARAGRQAQAGFRSSERRVAALSD